MGKELFDQLTKSMEQMVAIEKANWPQPPFTTTYLTLKACGHQAN